MKDPKTKLGTETSFSRIRETYRIFRFDRHAWFMLAAVTIGNVLFVRAVYEGQEWAAIALAAFGITWVFFHQLTRSLLEDVFASGRISLDGWKRESEYAAKISKDYAEVLGKLYEYDEGTADFYRERFSEALIARDPEEAAAYQAKAKQGDWN